MVFQRLLKSAEAKTAHNPVVNFAFDSRLGLVPGIKLAVGVKTQRNDGSIHPPHLRCGEEFISLDKVHCPAFHNEGGKTFIRSASLRLVDPPNSAKSFRVLSREGNEPGLLLHVETAVSKHPRITDKYAPDSVRAWSGVVLSGDIVHVLGDAQSSSCLLRFTCEGQEVLIFLQSGAVYKIVQQDGALRNEPLSRKEMAVCRVKQFEEQLALLGDSETDLKRRHGILGGAIRLLQLTKNEPKAREVLALFLRGYIDGRLTTRMQADIRSLLLEWNDPSAAFFVEGESNLVDLTPLASKFNVKKGPPAEVKKKRADRSAADSAARAKLKTPSGGKPQVAANPRKAAKREKVAAAKK